MLQETPEVFRNRKRKLQELPTISETADLEEPYELEFDVYDPTAAHNQGRFSSIERVEEVKHFVNLLNNTAAVLNFIINWCNKCSNNKWSKQNR